jgi:SAM-dependent methyltransferase
VTDGLYAATADAYARRRRSDPRIAAAIRSALGDVRTVVNVGAGQGAYEPADLEVTAVEPEARMIAARPTPAVQARAEALPFGDDAFDAAMAVLTIHHWSDWRAGVRELRRVARGPVVILMWDSDHTHDLWLLEYLPELDDYERTLFARPYELLDVLGGGTVQPVPVPHDCQDGFMGAYWRRPAEYLVPEARRAISSLALLDPAALERGLARLARDIEDGTWARRYAHLLERTELDLGYRLVVGRHT